MHSAKNRVWRRLVGLSAFVTLVVAFGLPVSRGSAAAGPAEQVIFSGVGFAGDGDWQSPVGFWIWCQPDGNGPYVGACAGAAGRATASAADAATPRAATKTLILLIGRVPLSALSIIEFTSFQALPKERW